VYSPSTSRTTTLSLVALSRKSTCCPSVICEDPGVVVRALDIDLRLVGVNEGAAQKLSAATFLGLSIVASKVAYKGDDSALVHAHVELFFYRLSDYVVRQAQHQTLVDRPGLQAAPEGIPGECADRRGNAGLRATLRAVGRGPDVLGDGLPTGVGREDQVDDRLVG
jgi:hypothetical protein